jgi:Bardet-Biedl syndrome 4 protein
MWSNYGNCYLEKDIYISVAIASSEALSCFKRALFLNPLDWAIYYNLGLVYLAIKLYSVAFHYFLSSIKYHPQNSDGYMLLGITLNKLKDPANAYNAFDKACALAPDNHLTHLNMAIFLSDHLDQPGNLDICREKFDAHDRLYRQIQAQSVAPDVEIENQRNNLLRVLKQ